MTSQGPDPETVTFPEPIVERASSAAWTVAAFALYAMFPVVCPRKLIVKVPPVAVPTIAIRWTSDRPA